MTEVPTAFELKEILATGTYGTVVVARVPGTSWDVAVKVLHTDHAGNAKILQRTRDEARMLHRLQHPNIVRVEHLLELQGQPIIVMEYVDGLSLDMVVRAHGRGLPASVALEICKRTALALEAAWQQTGPDGKPMRIIHRDIKPQNLLLGKNGEVKVVDFGIAKADFEDREAYTASMIMGSMGYEAPERLDDVPDTPAVDTYSLGLTLVYLLMGKTFVLPRLPTKHDEALVRQLAHVRPPELDEDQRRRLHNLLAQMCSIAREKRPSHTDTAAAIERLLPIAPDLCAFAREHVAPHLTRKPVRPSEHPAYADVAFLEKGLNDVVTTTHAPADAPRLPTLEEFLAKPDWPKRKRELDGLLQRLGTWDAAPFVAILTRAAAPKWKFWADKVPAEQIVIALRVLRRRPSKEVVALARAVSDHANAEVREAAAELLANMGG